MRSDALTAPSGTSIPSSTLVGRSQKYMGDGRSGGTSTHCSSCATPVCCSSMMRNSRSASLSVTTLPACVTQQLDSSAMYLPGSRSGKRFASAGRTTAILELAHAKGARHGPGSAKTTRQLALEPGRRVRNSYSFTLISLPCRATVAFPLLLLNLPTSPVGVRMTNMHSDARMAPSGGCTRQIDE